MKNILLILAISFGFTFTFAQGDETEEVTTNEPSNKVGEMFQDIRLVNMPTPLQSGKKALGFRLAHRFGFISDGIAGFYGLDGPASVYIGLDYGITDNLMVGMSRSSVDKLYSGFVKYNILDQTEDGKMPLTLSLFARANVTTLKDNAAIDNGFDKYEPFANRLSYVTQLLIARKFNNWLSVQIAPTFIHHNLVERAGDANSIFAISAGAACKITKRFAIVGEYHYTVNDHIDQSVNGTIFNSAGIGCEIGTGGHVFQVNLFNSFGAIQSQAIPYTRGDWLQADTRIGFNISRTWWF